MSTVPSLDRLHDIIPPPRISWWPPAVGWYVVAGIAMAVAVVMVMHWVRHWCQNAYRRAALREWRQISDTMNGHEQIQAFAELLKRTALAVYPRQQVAELCGDDWLRFLDRTAGLSIFERGSGRSLVTAVYDPRIRELNPDTVNAVRDWILRHQISRAGN